VAQYVSYAGVALPLATPELQAWADYVHPPDVFREYNGWNYSGFGLTHLPLPPLPETPPFKLDCLHWPTGACRPAWFHCVVNQSKLDELREAVGDPLTPQDLTVYDGRGSGSDAKTRTAALYMLPPRPISQFGADGPNGEEDLYLVTLTDVRFFLQWRRVDVTTTPVSWTALLATLASAAGVTLAPDAVSGAYGSPSEKWVGYDRPTAALLDAAAEAVGHKVVANLDGTFQTVTATTAQAAYILFVGDIGPTGTGHKVWGGDVAAGDIARYVPASVNTLFASGPVNTPQQPPYVVNQTLVSLGIPAYGDSTGMSGSAASVYADTAFDGTNAAACAAYAAQASEDWYAWRMPTADVSWGGVETYDPTGWEDWVEWTVQKRDGQAFVTTRVCRPEWDEFVSGAWYGALEDWPKLGQVLSSSGSPPVHVVRNQTRSDPGNLPTPVVPSEDFLQVLNPLGVAFGTGDYVEFWPVWEQPHWYWAHEFGSASGIAGFFGELLYSSGSGEDEGYGPWAVQPYCASGGTYVPNGGEVFPAYALVWVKRSECDATQYEFLAHKKWGCGIGYKFAEREWGLDLTGVASSGLVWSSGDCTLSAALACGLEFEADAAGVARIKVRNDDLVSPKVWTGLVPIESGDASGCLIGVDLECASTVTGRYLTDIGPLAVTVAGTNIEVTLTASGRTYEKCYNEYGLLVDWYETGSYTQVVSGSGDLDIDLLCACCSGDAPSVVATATPQGDCCWLFEAVGSGGTEPYDYRWDFDDGTTGAGDSVVHCFEVEGTYEVVVTVTDACGRTGTDSVVVECVFPIETACCPDDPTPAVLNWEITNITGNCSCIVTTSGTVAYGTGFPTVWGLIEFACLQMECEEDAEHFLQCVGDVWTYSGSSTLVSAQCDPFEVVFDVTPPFGGTYRITFSE
jgi:PKD repeat protein